MTDEGCRRGGGCSVDERKAPRSADRGAHTPHPSAFGAHLLPQGEKGALPPGAEVFRQLEPLALIVAAALAVEARRAFGQRLIDQSSDDLAVLQQEGSVVGADLQHALGPRA